MRGKILFAEHDGDDCVDIGDVHNAVTIYVTFDGLDGIKFKNVSEIIPTCCGPVDGFRTCRHIDFAIFIIHIYKCFGRGNRWPLRQTSHLRNSTAAGECVVTDGGDGVGDGDRGQAAAAGECVATDGGDGVGDGHRGQAAAVLECFVADGGDGVGGAIIGHRLGNDKGATQISVSWIP